VTLRTRLFLSLLLLALVPTAAYTLFTWDQLNRSIARWHRPGVSRALEAGLEVGRSSMARIESSLRASAAAWSRTWPAAPWTEAQRQSLSASLAGTGVDFVQIYRSTGDGKWRQIDQITPPDVLMAATIDLEKEIDAALAEDHTIRSGTIAGAERTPSGDVLIAAIQVSPDFFAQLESLGQGAVYYRQLGATVDLQRRWYGLLVGAIVVVLAVVALFLSRLLARSTAQPILELSAAFDRVAAGELGTRVRPEGASELARLGMAFNTMTGRLEAARASLLLAEREAAWRDVARTLAHEFKNMITPMKLNLQLIEHRVAEIPGIEGDAFRRQLKSVSVEVDHLARLSQQFAQYARLPEPRLEPLDPGEVAENAVRADASLTPRVVIRRAAAPKVRADRLLLGRAIYNLVLNAVEADASGQPIDVEVTTDGADAVIEVRDRGPGLPAELSGRLFEPYVSTKRRGSGLGLSLVRDIARQHGGRADLANREDGGACARLVLPLATSDDADLGPRGPAAEVS
jgi:two-component system, NtrC family, nitrogen regulation sensor histidine kinase NtrY